MSVLKKAWELIGHEGTFKVAGGRVTYENVDFNDASPGDKVRLARLEPVDWMKLRQINRYVDADTLIEVIEDFDDRDLDDER